MMLSPEYAILSSEAEPGRFPWSPGGQLEPENGAPPAESPPAESPPAGQSAHADARLCRSPQPARQHASHRSREHTQSRQQ